MNRLLLTFAFIAFCMPTSFTQITPEIYSWILNTDGSTGFNAIPSNVQQVQYSTGNVYVSATCIPGYDIGPWAGNPNTPANQNFVFKITRHPTQNTGNPVTAGLGHIGVWSNGVSIFNPKDAFSYNNQNVWHQNAIVVEGPSFDECLGHAAGNGEYHHHLNPTCLYNDSIMAVHSPIIGYAFDGFPVYGAFGYASIDGTGPIRRIAGSYRKRNISTRTTLPNGNNAGFPGPDVSETFPLGYYTEDFEYINGLGDLDDHNGRFCITPEYPQGIYCYFVTLDSNLVAEYPYIIGPTYYGTVQAGNTGPGSGHNTITESVMTYPGTTGNSNTEAELTYSVYPNPSNQFITFQVASDMPNDLAAELLNSLGQTILLLDHVQPSISYTLDLSGYAKGTYLIRLISTHQSVTKKIFLY